MTRCARPGSPARSERPRRLGQRARGSDDRIVQDRTRRTSSALLDWRTELERETTVWVNWDNSARLHSAIGHVPPVEHEQHYLTERSPWHPRRPERRL